MPALNIAFDIPQNPTFDVDDFSRKLKEYARNLISNATSARNETEARRQVLGYGELTQEGKASRARQAFCEAQSGQTYSTSEISSYIDQQYPRLCR